MAPTDRYLALAKTTIPLVIPIVFVVVKFRTGFGMMIIPFISVALLGIVQAVRSSGVIPGFSSGRKFYGSVTDTSHRGRALADELLDDR